MLAGPSMPPSVPVGRLPVEAALDIQTPSEPDQTPASTAKLDGFFDDGDPRPTMRLLEPGPSRSWDSPPPHFWPVIESIARPSSSSAEGTPGSGIQKVKRAKRGTACLRCKRQKTRCDGLMPCAICVTHGEEANCTYRSGCANLFLSPGHAILTLFSR